MTRTLDDPTPRKDLTIKQGSTWQMGMLYVDRDPVTGAAVIRDTSTLQSVLMRVRKTPTDPTVLFELSTANGRITKGITGTAPHQMNLVFKLPASVSRAVADFGCGVYDVRVVLANGDPEYWLEGSFTMTPEVSW